MAKFEFVDVGFYGGRATRITGEKPAKNGENQQQIQLHQELPPAVQG